MAGRGEGVHLYFCRKKGNVFLALPGRLDDYYLAIDVRLQSATWMRELIEMFNNTLLEPLTDAGKILLLAQYGSTAESGNNSPQQKIANAFVTNFNDAIQLTEAFHDKAKARQVVKEAFGSSFWPVLRGGLGVGKAQLLQMLGRPGGHPGT